MSLPKVSVIIVNYNGKLLLEKCLESLSKIDYESIEIIVVDNNSTDDSVEFLSKNYNSITLLKLDSNKGFAEPNNIAARMAKGDFLLFLNNDTIVTPTFLSELVHVMKDEKIGICQSLLLKPDGKIDSSGDFIDELGIVYNSKKHIDSVREIFSARGASMLIKKNIFEELDVWQTSFGENQFWADIRRDLNDIEGMTAWNREVSLPAGQRFNFTLKKLSGGLLMAKWTPLSEVEKTRVLTESRHVA